MVQSPLMLYRYCQSLAQTGPGSNPIAPRQVQLGSGSKLLTPFACSKTNVAIKPVTCYHKSDCTRSSMSTDAAVRETDNDAAVSRLSAVNAGYLDDPFATFFVKRAQARPPLINVGTFLRTWGIDSLFRQFLESGPPGQKKQVVSLGAGTDTRFFRIMTSGTPPQGAPRDESENQRASGQTRVRPSFSTADLHKYVEVDFAEATSKKAMAIKKQAKLSALLGDDVKLGARLAIFLARSNLHDSY